MPDQRHAAIAQAIRQYRERDAVEVHDIRLPGIDQLSRPGYARRSLGKCPGLIEAGARIAEPGPARCRVAKEWYLGRVEDRRPTALIERPYLTVWFHHCDGDVVPCPDHALDKVAQADDRAARRARVLDKKETQAHPTVFAGHCANAYNDSSRRCGTSLSGSKSLRRTFVKPVI